MKFWQKVSILNGVIILVLLSTNFAVINQLSLDYTADSVGRTTDITGEFYNTTNFLVSEKTKESILQDSELIASNLSQYFYQRYSEIEQLAKTAEIKSMTWSTMKTLLQTLVSNTTGIDKFILIHLNGSYYMTEGDYIAGQSLSNQSYFNDALGYNHTIISEPVISDSTGDAHIFFATPIRNSSNDNVGVLVGTVPLSHIQYIANKLISIDYTTLILSRSGMIIAHSEGDYIQDNITEVGEHSEIYLHKFAKVGVSGVRTMLLKGNESFIAYYPLLSSLNTGGAEEGAYVVIVEVPEATVLADLETIQNESDETLDVILAEEAVLQERFYMILFVMISVAIGVIILTSILFIKRSLEPVSKISKISEVVSTGDYTQRIDHKGKDEIGILAQNFNIMLDEVTNTVAQSKQISEKLSSVAMQLTSSAEEVLASSENIASSQQQISKGASSQVIAISQTQTQFQEVSDGIKTIQKNSSKIGDIGEIISNISAQTNMLALNAAIEAARAGEAGRGFNVVADQVRKLADASKTAVLENDNLLEDITHTTETQQMKTVKMVQAIDSIASVAEEISASTEESAAAAEEQSATLDEITNLAQALLEISKTLVSQYTHIKIEEARSHAESEDPYTKPIHNNEIRDNTLSNAESNSF